MNKVPAVKPLRLLILFTITIISTCCYTSWAFFPDQAEEYRVKADKFRHEGNLDQAIGDYRRAIELDQHSAAAHNGLAICYEQKGRLTRAEEEYLRALEVNPQYSATHYNLALYYEKYGEISRAIFHWRQRLQLGQPGEPGYIKARDKLAQYAPGELKHEQALVLMQSVEQQKEQTPLDKLFGKNKYQTREEKIQNFYLEGMHFFRDGDYRAAAEYFHKMIEALPVSD